jgi:hypothetical protein
MGSEVPPNLLPENLLWIKINPEFYGTGDMILVVTLHYAPKSKTLPV